jgi:uncharacterized membrane protein
VRLVLKFSIIRCCQRLWIRSALARARCRQGITVDNNYLVVRFQSKLTNVSLRGVVWLFVPAFSRASVVKHWSCAIGVRKVLLFMVGCSGCNLMAYEFSGYSG